MNERERFEAWAKSHCPSIERWTLNSDHYNDNRTELAWDAWQAATTIQEAGSGEAVGSEPGCAPPQEVMEWMWHMDLHLTEHDLQHAGKALRAAWPPVKDWIARLRGDYIALRNKMGAQAGSGPVAEVIRMIPHDEMGPIWYEVTAKQPLKEGAKLYATPPASAAMVNVPKEIIEIGNRIATQDNRCTDQPLFIVQQRIRVYGFDPDYCDSVVWLHEAGDYTEADEKEAAELTAKHNNGDDTPDWVRTGYKDHWEFVTACFTEQGCKDFIAINGRNLKETRIYANGSYRNNEFRQVRDWLLAAAKGRS